MRDVELPSETFRREREATWRRLEGILARAGRRGVRALEGEDLMALPVLHRATLSSLGVARAISLDKNLLDYLEGLAQRSYFCVYGVRRPLGAVARDFVTRAFPAAVRRFRVHLLVAVAATVLGLVASWALTASDPERFYGFVEEGLAAGRDPSASTERLREGLYDGGGGAKGAGNLGFFSSFLFAHNARVGMLVFALGFALGVPTVLLLVLNGLMLGAFGALYGSRGLGFDFWGWVLPHGVTELLAVLLCGAAGLALAEAMVFPGTLTRRHALARRGREAGVVVVGAVGMLFLAALLEGFFRQLVTDASVRWLVALVTAGAWTWYFAASGRGKARA